jgi:hypothetical protein
VTQLSAAPIEISAPTKDGIPPLWTLNTTTGKIDFNFHTGQAKCWMAKRRVVAMIAGSQGGKTSFGPLWLWREIRTRGPGDYMVVTPTGPLLRLKALPEFLRFFHDALQLGHWNKGDKWYEISREAGMGLYGVAEPSRIIFGSAINPEGLESATAKGAWLDEAGQQQFRQESWEAINRRTALFRGRMLITTTPYNLGYLKTEIHDPWHEGDPDITVVQFSSTSNPMFPPEELERAERIFPSWKVAMMYHGQLTKPDDLIYGDFIDHDHRLVDSNGRHGHLEDDFDIPSHWPRTVGIDFGGANMCTVWLAYEAEKDLWHLYHETLDGQKPTAEYAAEALDTLGPNFILHWVGGTQSEGQSRMDWAGAGVPVEEPETWDVEAGIGRVITLIKLRKLRVFKSCRGIRSEFGSYSRKMDMAVSSATDSILHKGRYHRLDALRYACTKIVPANLNAPDVLVLDSVNSGWTSLVGF